MDDAANDQFVFLSEEFSLLDNNRVPENFEFSIIKNPNLNDSALQQISVDESLIYAKNIANKENIKITTDLEALHHEINYLKQKLDDSELRFTESEKQIKQERQNEIEIKNEELVQAKSIIEKLSTDLEDQMNECFELHDKVNKLSCREDNYQQSLFNVVSKVNKELPNNNSIPELIEIVKELLNQNDISYQNIDGMSSDANNDSILDLDYFHTESICLKDSSTGADHFEISKSKLPKSKLPKLFQNNPKHASEHNLSTTSLNTPKGKCFVLSKELEKLKWEDSDKMDYLVEQSFLLFKKSILNIFGSSDEFLNKKLEKTINEFCEILTVKVKNYSTKNVDLNSTCIFEKLEHEFQIETSFAELTDKLKDVLVEKDNLMNQIELLKTENNILNSTLLEYKDKMSNDEELQKSLERNLTNLEILQDELKTLEQTKVDLENTIKISKEESESYKSKVLLLQAELCKAIEDKNNYFSELKLIEENLISRSNELEEVQQTNSELLNQLKGFNPIDDADLLKSEIVKLQSELNTRNVELESSVEDYLKISEELEDYKVSLLEKNQLLNNFEDEKLEYFENNNKKIEKIKADHEYSFGQIKLTQETLEKACDDLKINILEKDSLIRDLLDANEKLNSKLVELESEEGIKLDVVKNSEDFDKQMEILKSQVDELREIVFNLTNEKTLWVANNSELLKRLEESNCSINGLVANQSILHSELLEKDKMLTKMLQEVESNDKQLTSVIETVLVAENEVCLNKSQFEAVKTQTTEIELQLKNELMFHISRSDSLEKEILECQEILIEKEIEFKNLNESIERLENNLQIVSIELEDKCEIEQLHNKVILDLKLDLEEKTLELVELNDNFKKLSDSLLFNKAEESFKKSVDDNAENKSISYDDEIVSLNAVIASKDNIFENISTEFDSCKKELVIIKQKLLHAEEEANNERLVVELLKNHTTEVELQLKNELMFNLSKSETLQNDLVQCQNLLSEKEKEIQLLHESAELHQNNLIIVQKNLREITNQCEALQIEERQVEELQSKLQNYEREISELNEQFETACCELESLKEKEELLKKTINNLNENLEKEKINYDDCISSLKTNIAYKDEMILEVSHQIELNKAELSSVKELLIICEEKAKEDKISYELMKNKMIDLEDAYKMELTGLISKIDMLESELIHVQSLLNEKENETKIANEASEMFETELNTMRNKLNNTKTELNIEKQNFVQLKHDFEMVNRELEDLKVLEKITENSLKSQIELLENQIIEQNEKASKMSAMCDISQLVEKQKEIDDLKLEFDEKTKEIEHQKDALKSYDLLINHYNELKARYRTKRAQFDKMEEKLRSLKEENEHLRKLHLKDGSVKLTQDSSSILSRKKETK